MRQKPLALIAWLSAALLWASSPLFAQNGPALSEKELVVKWELARPRFLKGRDYFVKKEYGRAAAEFEASLKILPDNPEALFFLAQIDCISGDFVRALANIQEAETCQAMTSRASMIIDSEQRTHFLEDRKKKEKEIAAMEEILYAGNCRTDDEMLKLPESIEALRREISAINAKLNGPAQNSPQPIPADYSFVHGNILFKLERIRGAAVQYLKAIESDARHAGAYNNLINLFYMAKEYGNALKFVEQAEANGVSLNPKLKRTVIRLTKNSR